VEALVDCVEKVLAAAEKFLKGNSESRIPKEEVASKSDAVRSLWRIKAGACNTHCHSG
jgi:hypothetical protein